MLLKFSPGLSRVLKVFYSIAPWLPAVVTLVLIRVWSVNTPYWDSWGFVGEFLNWRAGKAHFSDLFVPHGPHPSAPGKLIFWFALEVMRGDLSWLPVLAWLFSLVVALGVNAMLRRHWNDVQRRWLMLLANSLIFTTAMGGTWIWDFVCQNYISGACLAAGFLMLTGSRAGEPSRILGCWALAAVAATSFGSGFFVGWLFVGAMVLRIVVGNEPRRGAWIWVGMTCVVAVLLTWLPSLGRMATENQTGERIDWVAGHPTLLFQYFLIIIGTPLAHGTAFDPLNLATVIGGLVCILTIGCLIELWKRRSDGALLMAASPWLAFIAFGLINVLLVALARMGNSVWTAVSFRYVGFTYFIMLGLALLLALLLRGRVRAVSLVPLITVFAVVQCLNWTWGASAMRHFHHTLLQSRAALDFCKILPNWGQRIRVKIGTIPMEKLAPELAKYDRLKGVEFINDPLVSSLPMMKNLKSGATTNGNFDRLARDVDGTILAQGRWDTGLSLASIPDIILISAQKPGEEEKLIGFNFPTLPGDIFADSIRRRYHEDHFLGWSVPLDQQPSPPTPGTTLRAYAYFGSAHRARPMAGEFKL